MSSALIFSTTGLAAKNLNRKFIGIEKDERYFEIAKQRLGV
jgi:DNA modification methylase